MTTIGIDIDGRTQVAARCGDVARADRQLLRVNQGRAGFVALGTWLDRQPEPVPGDDGIVGPILDAARESPGATDVPVAAVNPLGAKYFARADLAGRSPTRPYSEPHRDGLRDTPTARIPGRIE